LLKHAQYRIAKIKNQVLAHAAVSTLIIKLLQINKKIVIRLIIHFALKAFRAREGSSEQDDPAGGGQS
jgi:hypothetical protein